MLANHVGQTTYIVGMVPSLENLVGEEVGLTIGAKELAPRAAGFAAVLCPALRQQRMELVGRLACEEGREFAGHPFVVGFVGQGGVVAGVLEHANLVLYLQHGHCVERVSEGEVKH